MCKIISSNIKKTFFKNASEVPKFYKKRRKIFVVLKCSKKIDIVCVKLFHQKLKNSLIARTMDLIQNVSYRGLPDAEKKAMEHIWCICPALYRLKLRVQRCFSLRDLAEVNGYG